MHHDIRTINSGLTRYPRALGTAMTGLCLSSQGPAAAIAVAVQAVAQMHVLVAQGGYLVLLAAEAAGDVGCRVQRVCHRLPAMN